MTTVTRNVYVDGQRIAVNTTDPSASASPRCIHTGGIPARVTTDGTDTTPVITETYVAECYVPGNFTTTGVAMFNGTVASGNVTAIIYNSAGYVLGTSASTAMAGTDAYQLIPLAVTLTPGTYYIGLQVDNVTGRINTHTVGSFGAGKITGGTYGTFVKITVPSTFTTALGPIASLY